jgi:hypothetical protein
MAKKMIDLSTLMKAIASAAGVDVVEPTTKKTAKAKAVRAAKTDKPRRERRPALEGKPERAKVDPMTVPAELRHQVSTCPKCGHKGPIGTDFGVRMHRGVLRKQSWCADCRSKTNYHDKPRKYQSSQNH